MSIAWKQSIVAVLICLAGAAPSFLWSRSFNLSARLTGIALFVAIYATLPHTPWFEQAWSRRRVRRALQIGYTVRAGISVVFPVGMMVDLVPGMFSLAITGLDVSQGSSLFWGVLVTTVLQGVLLHLVLAGFIGLVYGVVRATGTRDDEPHGRAFEVIPLARPAKLPPR